MTTIDDDNRPTRTTITTFASWSTINVIREHRLYETPHHNVRFFFVTRAWDDYWKHAVVPILRLDPQPDVVIVNSCLWDLTRYGHKGGAGTYRDHLDHLMKEMKKLLPPATVFIWNTTLPLRCVAYC